MNKDVLQTKKTKILFNTDIINSAILSLSKKPNSSLSKLLSNKANKKFLLTTNLDNFYSDMEYSKIFYKKYIKIIEYINKLIVSGRVIKYKKIFAKKEIIPKITNIFLYLVKSNINNKKNKLNQKLFQLILLMIYSNIFPAENFALVINIYLQASIMKEI
jgi:hypothetical protein